MGRLLAPLLGWRFVDTDAVLVERYRASVASLFAEHGEPRFREWEAEVVAEALAGEQVVVALGGGAVEHPQTQPLLGSDNGTVTVFLEVPLTVALARCASEPGSAARPVLANAERLQARYRTRLPLYRSAHLALPTETQSPIALARAIAEAVELRAETAP